MADLVAFLRSRFDEDEQMARAATWCEEAGVWHAKPTPYGARGWPGPRWFIEDALEDGVISHVDPQASDDEGVARHIARHDPDRVLRDVESKRRILAWHSQGDNETCQACLTPGMIAQRMNCFTLRLLALPFDDHEDFKPEWKP
ncbi:hypothetical protein GCM10017559_08290 [Streptosporangium longisporum]|uniref:Uncharacterized protein n=1 Tax=Streptosporangium longisporum TaxID=46187 RepID=A0ABN3XRK8_9ACTN